MDEIKMRVAGIEKSFPGVKALSNIDFSVAKEPCHALCGERGRVIHVDEDHHGAVQGGQGTDFY